MYSDLTKNFIKRNRIGEDVKVMIVLCFKREQSDIWMKKTFGTFFYNKTYDPFLYKDESFKDELLKYLLKYINTYSSSGKTSSIRDDIHSIEIHFFYLNEKKNMYLIFDKK